MQVVLLYDTAEHIRLVGIRQAGISSVVKLILLCARASKPYKP